MKKIHLLLLGLTICLFTACHDKLWDAIDGLDSRVTKLEELCKEMNTNITSLQTIVSVLQSNDFITGIVEIKKNGEVIGYTITFGKHDPITIYHGQDGKDGADGKDGQDGQNGSANTPVIGVAQDTDSVYYWTLNGEWLLDDNGNKLPVSGKDGQNGTNGSNGQDGADGKDGQDGEDGKDGADGQNGKDGITPQLKIEDGYWYISYDNGATWTELGKATGEDGKDGADGENGKDGQNGTDGKDGQDGDSMFQSVTQDENYVYFTLADGTVIKIAKGNGSNDQPNGDEYIDFKDLDVKYLLLTSGQNIDFNKDNQISYDEAAAFRGRLILQQGNYNDTKTFKSFTEFKYFINVTSCEIGAADLFEIEFPDGLDSIMSCKGKLQSIKIPQGCRYIASHAFCKHGASETTSTVSHIIWNDSIEYIGYNAFGSTPLQLSSIPNSIKTLESGALYVSSQTFTFPENLIGDGGGVRMSGVETVYWNAVNFKNDYIYTTNTYSYRGLGGNRGYVPNSYNSSYDVYDYDNEIKKVIFGSKVKVIPAYLCAYLDGLNEVIIPDNVELIGTSAFYDCRNLTTVTIGTAVQEIGTGSFITGKSTSNLSKIYCRAQTPPTIRGSLNSTFPPTVIIYVPRSSVEEYKIVWSDYADKIIGYDFE